MPEGVGVGAGVCGVAGCGGGGELGAAEVVAGERGAEVGGRLGDWGRHARWTVSPIEVTGISDPLPTTIDEGEAKVGGWGRETLPMSGMM